ncbi:DUF2570 domain-containing protein [Pluralibacter gergoviae]|uniref:DUF2570 domain-containing protein n=1 Tax=Pluralibacter gergoviae TaxID=61647 RepID=A0AAI9GK08_PLUGE|nr:DUF2570 domain-containing protein [Pluralibacter gergoviae]EKV9907730.1 DUF2570 domain-containing protein [Pluralibacter gergoviae]EKW7276801.1 DUF2570 domain-containing protein [Pluralibacter gergoviae]ELD4293938.1 DUF2570 domain-containing protein [Pluralibacter gergoviae]ELD4304717.1 DUF2570 domain-containing protein [Pluralibacter gergoviae]
MTLRYRLIVLAFMVALIAGILWTAAHYHSKYLVEQKRTDAAEQRADSTEAITANVLRTVTIMNQITEGNQHAKGQITLESSRASRDIKTAVAGDDCAARAVPAGAAYRLREYADSLRSGAVRTAAGRPDR